MGSKSALLRGELGSLLLSLSAEATRFVDLFSGSGSVSHFIAESSSIPVLSVDLQHYSKIFAESIIGREGPVEEDPILTDWTSSVKKALIYDATYRSLREPVHRLGKATVLRSRRKVKQNPNLGFITSHYGGHYYSPQQAYVLDQLYNQLPVSEPHHTIALAALLHTASTCAAAPGHTAQPFQPTEKLLPYIKECWSRDVINECEKQVGSLSSRHAKVRGRAETGDALSIASKLSEGDLVFCDPPYSAVQYSRFYHVLEGIARGGWQEVFGAGRAPARIYRESSSFSMKTQANNAMSSLLECLHQRSCRVVLTFPNTQASNGLSSDDIIEIARPNWEIREIYVDSSHSTLGGSSSTGGRSGRISVQEAILILDPKRSI